MARLSRILAALVLLSACALGQTLSTRPGPAPSGPPMTPNSDGTYQALRRVTVGGEAVQVTNWTLKRDAATFTLTGTLSLLAPVNGKVTGAVFQGEGTLAIQPPIPVEHRTLAVLTRGKPYLERFSTAVFRFTDGTDAELRKAGSVAAPGSGAQGALSEINNRLRTTLDYNLTIRLLQDVLSPQPGGYFAAFIDGKEYSGKTLFVLDPHGAEQVAPEEVALITYDEGRGGIWTSFHLTPEYASGAATGTQKNAWIDILDQDLDTTIEKSARLDVRASTTFRSGADGLRVVMFDLFPTLRVSSVMDAAGQQLPFIQEDKDEDAQFGVILPRPLAAGETFTLLTSYAGKDAVSNEGNGNYFPVARTNWYPNTTFGDYAQYKLTFRVPKGMKTAGTGTLVRELNEGGQTITEWKSEVPQAVAGFNFGRFKKQEAKLADGFLVEAYANDDVPDDIKALLHLVNQDLPLDTVSHADSMALGNLSTIPMMKKALAEGQVAMQLYTDYFGPLPYKNLAMTQQTACNFGQAWPGVVYLPICSFFDSTQKNQLGLLDTRGYWTIVAPHEVAHQWWGHVVGFESYRDQWMSEGFAELSASIFIQQVFAKDPQRFQKFWEDERQLLTERNREGNRAIDVGPVTLGYRLSNSRVGIDVTRRLIYPKGAYILHMVRMMMWNRNTGDQLFKQTMQDFVKTYANRAATTEDFKAMLEKHWPKEMDFTGDGKLDWFFNQYVYGTALPTYTIGYTFETAANGDQVLNVTVSQSKVGDDFLMPVPIYIELANGRIVRLGSAIMKGNTTQQTKIPLTNLKQRPKRAMLNYYYDVLSAE